MNKITQEELASKLNITRQTLSKWETGESLPDIEKSMQLAELFDISLDELVSTNQTFPNLPLAPKGKHAFGIVTVGEKGQIVIPAKARKIFDIHAGDSLVVLGDEAQGIAIVKEQHFVELLQTIRQRND